MGGSIAISGWRMAFASGNEICLTRSQAPGLGYFACRVITEPLLNPAAAGNFFRQIDRPVVVVMRRFLHEHRIFTSKLVHSSRKGLICRRDLPHARSPDPGVVLTIGVP